MAPPLGPVRRRLLGDGPRLRRGQTRAPDGADYTVETHRRLAGAAGELLRRTLRRLVEERAQVNGGSFVATVRERLACIELSFPGGTFRGGATRVELRGVHLTPTGFEVVLGAAGPSEIILGP